MSRYDNLWWWEKMIIYMTEMYAISEGVNPFGVNPSSL